MSSSEKAVGKAGTGAPVLPWKMPTFWWLKQRRYFLYMIREVTALSTAIFAAVLLYQMGRLGEGAAEYETFLAGLRSTGWMAFCVVAFILALFHSVTWFKLAGSVFLARIAHVIVPPLVVTVAGYGAWLLLSAVVVVVLFWS